MLRTLKLNQKLYRFVLTIQRSRYVHLSIKPLLHGFCALVEKVELLCKPFLEHLFPLRFMPVNKCLPVKRNSMSIGMPTISSRGRRLLCHQCPSSEVQSAHRCVNIFTTKLKNSWFIAFTHFFTASLLLYWTNISIHGIRYLFVRFRCQTKQILYLFHYAA